MNLMPCAWFFIILFSVFVIQRALETFSKRKKEPGDIKHKWTFSLLLIAYVIVAIGAILEFLLLKRDINYVITILGIILYLVGLIGRNWSIKTLGRYWSTYIEIRKEHKLIRNGPYKYVRHPTYLSIIFEVWGAPLIVNSYFTFLFAVMVYIPLIFLMTHLEETEHRKLFGSEYLAYKSEVGAFFPLTKPK